MLKKFFRATVFFLLSIVLLAGALFVYAVKIEPYRLRIQSLTFQTDLSEDLKIVQISDVQIRESFTAKHFDKVVEMINQQAPDLVLFTGDLYENYTEHHEDAALIDALCAIQSSYGKYAIWGNRDYGGGAVHHYPTILEKSGFQILRNDWVSIMPEKGKTLFLAGLDDALLGSPDESPVRNARQSAEPGFSILMTHEPDVADSFADAGFDLILAGHSHGGQVNLPFWSQPTTALARKYTRGLYLLSEQTNLYVNTGIGTSRYPVRFGVVPEITVFHLMGKK